MDCCVNLLNPLELAPLTEHLKEREVLIAQPGDEVFDSGHVAVEPLHIFYFFEGFHLFDNFDLQ